MVTLVLMLLGWLAFIAGAAILGVWLRKVPTKLNAEKFSRIMHFLFFAGLGAPALVGFFTPGLTHFDELLGLSPLPAKPLFLILGILLALPGLYFMVGSNILLRLQGGGANAFRLTKRIVLGDMYQRTRNPMSLGYYLVCVSLGLITGSTFITLAALLAVIPAHLFFLKYFEERELELRFGDSYLEYKRSVPFLFPRLAIPKAPPKQA